MLQNYPCLLGLGALLLVGCGQSRPAAETAAPPRATPPPTAAVPPALPPRPPVAGAVTAPLIPLSISKSVTLSVPVAAAEAAETSAVDASLTAAADTASDNDLTSTAGDAALASTAELRAFLQTGLPAPCTFAVRPGRDTLLRGAQGTQVLLPADAWDVPDSTAVVQLEIQEFYRPADMVLAGLSTTAGPRLLETGGMLHLAATANGQPVRLRPGAFVHLRLPAPEQQAGMHLFEGVAAAPHQPLDWREPVALLPLAARPAIRSFGARKNLRGRSSRGRRRLKGRPNAFETNPPEYARGERGFRKDLQAGLDYSDALRARLRRGRRISRAERLTLLDASQQYHERVLRLVTFDLAVDSTGAMARAVPRPGADAELTAHLNAALHRLPRWRPATYSEAEAPDSVTAGPVSRLVTLAFTESGRVQAELTPWQLTKAMNLRRDRRRAWRLRLRFAAWHRLDSLHAAHPRYYDSLTAVQQARAAAELARLRTQFTDTSTAAISEAGVYNELSAQGLSWINCDRYLGPGPLITFKVNADQPGTVVTLLFKGFRSVMGGQQQSATRTAFRNVPLGSSATVVALRRENGITYLATRTTLMGPLALGSLTFHPVTMPELRAELARLN